MKISNPIRASVQFRLIIGSGRSVQLPRSFAWRSLWRSGFALLLFFFTVTDPVGLQAQQPKPVGAASSHKNDKVLRNDASELTNGRIESSLIKRIVLQPVRSGENSARGGDPGESGCDFSAYAPVRITFFDRQAIRKRVEPEYPREALKRGVQGSVVVKTLINDKGIVEKACAIEGEEILKRAAESAAIEWKLRPGYGLAFARPITRRNPRNFAEAYIRFDFKLNNSGLKTTTRAEARPPGIRLTLLSIRERSSFPKIKPEDYFEVPADDLVVRLSLANNSHQQLYYLAYVSTNEPVGNMLFRTTKGDGWKERSPRSGDEKFTGNSYHWVAIPPRHAIEFEVLDLSAAKEDHAVTLFVNTRPEHVNRIEIVSSSYHPTRNK